VRAIAVGIVRRGNELLAMRVRDDAGRTKGWRPLCGAIELGERASDAVTREFREELGLELTNLHFRAVLENIYEHEGAQGHELVMVFDATFADATAYDRAGFHSPTAA
jgi:ADP-ribose pyrophosphatase YjhB (NUDIX family)